MHKYHEVHRWRCETDHPTSTQDTIRKEREALQNIG